MTLADKRQHCVGCTENFYNGNNPYGIQQCWMLPRAKLVTRYQIGTWTPMDSARNFHEVKVFDCRHEKGSALCTGIPAHLAAEWRILKRKAQKDAR